jgi:hypothetical protein
LARGGNLEQRLTAQPTLAFGKDFGDFDIQPSVSVQIPVGELGSLGTTAATNMANFGDPILWNTTFQYNFLQYFWPKLEVKSTGRMGSMLA